MRSLASVRALKVLRPRPAILLVKAFDWHGALLAPLAPLISKWATHDVVGFPALVDGWRPCQTPEIVIVCDAGLADAVRMIFPDTCVVHVGHGLISKNQTAYHYAKPDYVCVSSDFTARRLTERGHVPRKGFLVTGLMQTDPLFSGSAEIPLRPRSVKKTTIAYAPTWNPSLSSAEMIGADVLSRLWASHGSVRVLIKPHPHSATFSPEWISMWQATAERAPEVQLCDPEGDLVPALIESDLLVSDASSAIFHFLALDRPIVLLDNPARFSSPECFDPDGIEWQWRDIARRVDRAEDVSRAVAQELANPDLRRPQRQLRRTQLYGELTDGRATERINAALKGIVGF